ncbi:MAG: SpaA isopeptide-forming pilin-related protein [Clostridia bacterium]
MGLNIKGSNGRLSIRKIDAETKEPLSGVMFQIKSLDNTVLGTCTTDKNGIAYLSEIYPQTVKIIEIATKDEYIISKEEKQANLVWGKTTEIEFTNQHKKGSIKILKVDKDNPKLTLGAVEFQLINSKGDIVKTVTTDVNGEALIENINTGNYTLRETKTKKEYELAVDSNTTIEWNKEISITVPNEKKKGQVRVIKVDLDNNEIRVPNVVFEIYNEKGYIVDTIKTNENGEAVSERLPIDEQYTIKETITGDSYVLNDEIRTITLERNQIKELTFKNEKKKGQIRVIKVDVDNNEIKLKDVEFKVFDEKGKLVDTIRTDENGEAVTKRLAIDQKYKVQESVTGKWYVLNETPQTATLQQEQIISLTFTNEKKKGQVRVIKVDLDNKEIRIPNVEFNVLNEKKEIVDTIKTNEKGEAVTKKLPIDQKYTLVETKTLDNYVLNEIPQTVILKQDQIIDITFENEKIKGYIQITKTSAENNQYSELEKETRLEKAIFEVYNSENILVDTLITNKEGQAITKELLKGKYTIKEIKAPDYYIINENTFDAEIITDQEIVNVDVKNDNVDIKVEINKNGFIETQNKDTIFYNFSNIHNKSNVPLDNFIWEDELPSNAVRANRIYTGTYNQDLNYSIWFKTNKNDYKLLKSELNTKTNYEVNFKDIGLLKDEYITDYQFRFNTVGIGFKEVEQPILYCDMLDNMENGFIFTNNTKVSGTYLEKYVEDTDKWTTITYFKEIELNEVLPRTGK